MVRGTTRVRSVFVAACVAGAAAGCGSTTGPTSGSADRPATDTSSSKVAAGTVATGTQTTGTRLINGPLPVPAGANVISAASPQSLFRRRNLARVLSNLTAVLGQKASITNLALYPGEIDLVLDQPDGAARRIRIERDGTISEGKPYPVYSGPTAIYLNQIDSAVPQQLANRIAQDGHVPVAHLAKMVLVLNLPGQNAGWRVYPMGTRRLTFLALLDGSGLKAQLP